MDNDNDSHKERFIPEWITQLGENEVFVFGSNLEGMHGGEAARIAFEKFGAQWGIGEGPTGNSYAIPTMHGGLEAIRPYVDKFVEYAACHQEKRFLLTRVGCGIAGFRDNDMAPLFWQIHDLDNVAYPKEWDEALSAEYHLRKAK